MIRASLVFSLALVACKREPEPPPPKLLDTGWFVDTAADTGTVEDCPAQFVSQEPSGGEVGWYWRDAPVVFVTAADPTAYDAWLVEPSGQRVDGELVWDEAGLSATLDVGGPLAPSAEYTLWTSDCLGPRSVSFTTSSLGSPLVDGPGGLVGTTWRLDLNGATWIEPAALSGLLAVYFSTPILLGVQYADGANVDFIGAPGYVDPLGRILRYTTAPSWDFPVQAFDEQPYFEAEVSSITLEYQDGSSVVPIPVQDFRLFATVAPDGSVLGGAKLAGLADTRGMGGLLRDDDNPLAICEFAATIGVSCVPCADNGPYCLRLSAEDLDGVRVPGLTLRSQ